MKKCCWGLEARGKTCGVAELQHGKQPYTETDNTGNVLTETYTATVLYCLF